MKYQIKIYILIETEEAPKFNTLEKAEEELKHLQLLNPENHYEIQEIRE